MFRRVLATVLALLSEIETPDGSLRIVDLGAGTGLMSAMILDSFPRAHLTLVDAAESMLDLARQRVENESQRVALVVADFLAHSWGGPYDAVVSALAIHHLEHEDKRILFGRVHDASTPMQMDGTYGDYQPSPAKAGDKMVLKAMMDVVAVGSACPFDLMPLNGDRLTDILFIVRDS